jgi:alkanesulfonate monooxygenase SsuD/methylene tetrahydromethanopterin reductase-like flavin-dependent oxidoreductase (luciferase family)
MIDSARSQDELAASLLPEWVDQLSVTGTPADCARSIGRLASAGADRIVLIPALDRVDQQARILGEEVLPLLS